jgi:hypothetical protein
VHAETENRVEVELVSHPIKSQAAASNCGCWSTRNVNQIEESGNVVCRLLLGIRLPANVRKILDVTLTQHPATNNAR